MFATFDAVSAFGTEVCPAALPLLAADDAEHPPCCSPDPLQLDASLLLLLLLQHVLPAKLLLLLMLSQYMLQGVLSPPPPLGSALLLPLPWAQLLRLLLQQGLPAELLQQLWGPSSDDDEVVEAAVWNCLPGECCRAWQQAPHRMGTEEAQVGCLACWRL